MNDKIFEQIVSLINSEETIPQSQILEWMKSDDLKILGPLHELVYKGWKRIEPALDMKWFYDFNLHYYIKCIIENPLDGDWLANRSISALELANFMKALWDERPETDEILKNYTIVIKKTYIEGNEDIRECIVNGFLEHVFEKKEMIKLFADWENDPQLSKAYEDAMAWARDHWGK